jgi:hypothetical protein
VLGISKWHFNKPDKNMQLFMKAVLMYIFLVECKITAQGAFAIHSYLSV